jgi:osmotically inducible protein OsmC
MKSTARATWAGSMTESSGKITAGSGLFKDAPYSAKGRFEGGVPGTTPEELIAAAHAGCYTMALGFGLMRANMPAKAIDTSCEVEVVMGAAGADITRSALTCKVDVPGADAGKVREIAEGAKKNCPVSKALAGIKDISLKLDVKV